MVANCSPKRAERKNAKVIYATLGLFCGGTKTSIATRCSVLSSYAAEPYLYHMSSPVVYSSIDLFYSLFLSGLLPLRNPDVISYNV